MPNMKKDLLRLILGLNRLSLWDVRAFVFIIVGVLGITGCKEESKPVHSNEDDQQATSPQLANLVLTLSQRVVKIEATDKNGQKKSGTGFFVSSDGKIATCAHIIRDAKMIRVTTLTGAQFQFDRVLRMDFDRDLALISLKAAVVSPFDRKDAPSVGVGLPVAALGNPLGLTGTFADGVISAIRTIGPEQDQILQISVPISPGSSGSPVVSLDGGLVGMVGSRAHGGEGIGFALPAEYIWEALAEPFDDTDTKEPYKVAFAMARERYTAGDELAKDQEWNHGFIRGVVPHRLAALERLRSKYPEEAILTIEIIRCLWLNHKHDRAYEECVRLLEKDPGNRLAADELTRVSTRRDKVPFIEAAVAADPLNWRAREFLFNQEKRNDQFLSAMMSARTTHLTVPFSLEIAESHIQASLDHLLHELVDGRRSFEPARARILLDNIEGASLLRERIAKAAQVLVTPNEQTLKEFLIVAKEHPDTCFPYAWELLCIGENRQSEFGEIRNGSIWEDLREIIHTAKKLVPLTTEAYFLDFAAVDIAEGLLLDSARGVQNDLMLSLGIELPFDQVAMIFLLAESAAESPIFSPQSVSTWATALDNYERSLKAFSGVYPRIRKGLQIIRVNLRG